mgnify:FL=1
MNVVDNTLYLIKNLLGTVNVDGENVPVRHWTIQTSLNERGVFPVFERPANLHAVSLAISENGEDVLAFYQARRMILPMFRWDPMTQLVEGGDGIPTTMDERMVAVIEATRSNGFDDHGPENIREVEQYVHIHAIFADGESHMQGCLPFFDQMNFWFMVQANIVPQPVE